MATLSSITSWQAGDPYSQALFNSKFDSLISNIRAVNSDATDAWFNLQTDYGATGDGTTDDTVAIQNALAAGGRIYAPAGTYKHTGVSIPAGTIGLRLVGAGQGKTIFQNTGTGVCFSILGGGSSQITAIYLADMTIKGQAGTTTGVLTDFVYHSVFERLEVSHHSGDGVKLQQGFYNSLRDLWTHRNHLHGIYLGKIANANLVVGGHSERNFQNGIMIYPDGDPTRNHGNTVVGLTVESNAVYNAEIFDSDENRFYGCYFESGGTDTTTAHVRITDDAGDYSAWNVFHGCNFAGAFLNFTIDRAKNTLVEACSINYGYTVTANALNTRFINNLRSEGTLTDSGVTTVVLTTDTLGFSATPVFSATRFLPSSGSATSPSLAFSSEVSLGLYRSAASVLRQSYGALEVSGLRSGVTIQAGNYTLTLADFTASFNSTSTTTATLPAPSTVTGQLFRVKRQSTGTVVVEASSGASIDSAFTDALTTVGQSQDYQSYGTGYFKV